MLKISDYKKKTLKCIFKILELFTVGIIAGLFVTHLFNTPQVSLTGTNVIVNGDKIDISYFYENKGKSAAINISLKYSSKNLNTNNFIKLKDGNLDRVEVGDNFSFSPAERFTIRNKSNFIIIILSRIEYDDVSKLRKFINEKLLNNSYTIYKWAFYDYEGGRKYLSIVPLDLKEKYKEELLKRIED